ncbi:hypothetical protein Tco_0832689 [Tanacetum coccineum]
MYECNFMILEDTTSIIDHHIGEVVFRKPFVRKTGLVYDQEEGMVTFEKDNEKITFKMPHKMEAFNHIDFKDVNTDSIPPFVLENNNDRGKTYYSDSLTLGPEYREDESISKEIRHLMKLERKAKRNKGEFTYREYDLAHLKLVFEFSIYKVWKSVEYGVSKELDTAYWGFLGVGTTFDIFQNIILISYLEYGVLSPLDTAY